MTQVGEVGCDDSEFEGLSCHILVSFPGHTMGGGSLGAMQWGVERGVRGIGRRGGGTGLPFREASQAGFREPFRISISWRTGKCN